MIKVKKKYIPDRVRLRATQSNTCFEGRKFLLGEVQGAPHTFSSTIEDVRVDHRRSDVPVPQQLLYRPNVVPFLKKMGSERMPKGMTGNRFGKSGTGGGLLYGFLEHRFVQMVTK